MKFFGAVVEAAKRKTDTEVDASNLQQLFDKLSEQIGGSFKQNVLDQVGKPQSFVNVYVNGRDIRHLGGLETQLNDGDEVLILPAIAGG